MCNACGKEEQGINTGVYYEPEILVSKNIIYPANSRKYNRCMGSFITSDGKIYEYHFDFSGISDYQLSLDAYSYEYIYAYIEEHYKTDEKEFNYIGQLDERKLNELWTSICQLPNDTEKYENLETCVDGLLEDNIWTVYRKNHIGQLEHILLKVIGYYEITNHNLGAEELLEDCLPYTQINSSTDDRWLWSTDES